ncbi:MAG TPA: hypothetical protein ACFYEA_01560 [Candidatus Tripitaka californicus]|uniref:hypothetical protein n=1 Tax=Candidatus Tripitaka californicus TaxID=3367616 RepID=UPI004027DEC6|nr:hypothetical protein [Planctomycetota bacterium]
MTLGRFAEANFSLRGFLIMERKIDIDLIIWLVFLLLLFGGSLIKWLIRRFSKGSVLGQGEGEGKEEAAPQEGRGTLQRAPTLMEEFKKMLEGMVLEERPEIVIVEERPTKRRPKHLKMKVPKESPPVSQPILTGGAGLLPTAVPLPPGVSTAHEVTLPLPKAPLVKTLPRDELQKAVVLSEILGPPRARRRHYRLF